MDSAGSPVQGAVESFSSQPIEALFEEITDPMRVSVILSQVGASKEMDGQGGTIQVNENTDFQFTLGKDTLETMKAISLTPIQSIGGLDSAWTFIAGVQLTPDGTTFASAGKLTISIPEGFRNKKLTGFSYEGDGKDFSFYPITVSDGMAVFDVYGFSGYGLVSVEDFEAVPPKPSSIEKQAKQYLAAILRESAGLDDVLLKRIENILSAWYETSVKPKLDTAERDSDGIRDAGREFMSWLAGHSHPAACELSSGCASCRCGRRNHLWPDRNGQWGPRIRFQ